jgi:hypothetical protein
MDSRSTLDNALKQIAAYLQSQPDVLLGYLFGSQARHQARADSDMDVAILLDVAERSALDLLERRLDLAAALSDLIQTDVDVVLLNRASLLLQGQVLGEGQILYAADPQMRVEYEARTRSLYFDFQPRLQQHTDALLDYPREVSLEH